MPADALVLADAADGVLTDALVPGRWGPMALVLANAADGALVLTDALVPGRWGQWRLVLADALVPGRWSQWRRCWPMRRCFDRWHLLTENRTGPVSRARLLIHTQLVVS